MRSEYHEGVEHNILHPTKDGMMLTDCVFL